MQGAIEINSVNSLGEIDSARAVVGWRARRLLELLSDSLYRCINRRAHRQRRHRVPRPAHRERRSSRALRYLRHVQQVVAVPVELAYSGCGWHLCIRWVNPLVQNLQQVHMHWWLQNQYQYGECAVRGKRARQRGRQRSCCTSRAVSLARHAWPVAAESASDGVSSRSRRHVLARRCTDRASSERATRTCERRAH